MDEVKRLDQEAMELANIYWPKIQQAAQMLLEHKTLVWVKAKRGALKQGEPFLRFD